MSSTRSAGQAQTDGPVHVIRRTGDGGPEVAAA
jgi:hypothetical protein